MSIWYKMVGFGALVLALGGCLDPVGFASAKPVPLAYVGQITLGRPVKSATQTIIPVSYTGGQWVMNSAWVPYGMDVDIKDGVIVFTDKVSLPGNHDPSAVRRLILPASARGVFKVKYRDPDGTVHDVGSIDIGD